MENQLEGKLQVFCCEDCMSKFTALLHQVNRTCSLSYFEINANQFQVKYVQITWEKMYLEFGISGGLFPHHPGVGARI